VPTPADYLPPLNAYDAAALNAITANDPVTLFLDKEQQRADTEYLQNEQVLHPEDDEEEQYQAAIAASLAVAHTTHLISSMSSSWIPSESFALSAPSPSSFTLALPLGPQHSLQHLSHGRQQYQQWLFAPSRFEYQHLSQVPKNGHRKIRVAGCVRCVHVHELACTCVARSLHA